MGGLSLGDDDHADAEIEGPAELWLLDPARPEGPVDGRLGPGAPVQRGLKAVREHTRDVIHQTTAGDMGEGVNVPAMCLDGGPNRSHIDSCRLQQRLPEALVGAWEGSGKVQTLGLQEGPSRQAVAIGVETAGGQTQDHVTLTHVGGIQELLALDRADSEPGQVILAVCVHARHLSGLSAQERAASLSAALCNPRDHIGTHGRLQMTGGKVVEEEERLRPRDQYVVHAHGHQIDAHGVMAIQGESQLELGADSVGAADQHGIGVPGFRETKQPSKTTDTSKDASPMGRSGQGTDSCDQVFARVNIHTSIAVGEPHCGLHFVLAERSYTTRRAERERPSDLSFIPRGARRLDRRAREADRWDHVPGLGETMNRLWITLAWVLLTGLWGCKSAEQSPATPEAPAPALAGVETPGAAAATETPTEPLEGLRRERAGIDLGSSAMDERAIDGRKPAARLLEPKEVGDAPPRLQGAKALGARAARAFVLGPWKGAVEHGDPARLRALLTDPFTGIIADGETQEPISREAWPTARGGLGAPVTLSELSIAMVGSAKGDSTLRFHERTGLAEACKTRTRELTLSVEDAGELRVRVVHASPPVACGDQSPSPVAAAHHELMKLWKNEDRLEAASTTASVWLRDFGLDVRTYTRADLHQGDGRWLLEALAKVEATEENTTRVGTVGQVTGANGMVFSYHWTQERWTWQGVDRVR